MQLLSARGGVDPGAPTMVLQHREALIWTLGKAAALEQLVMCQYLYAAFSMKDREDEGLSQVQLEATRRWRRELIHIAEQEMLHLALVQNLLTAVGAGSAFERPNFPLPPHAYPAGIKIELLPFNETSLRHLIYLERPEGLDMAVRDADPGFEPSRPVLAACVREREDGVPVPIITDPFTSRCVDLLNAVYEVILQLLARYFAHTDETEDHLAVLAEVSVGLMKNVVKPLGGLVTRLPVGPAHPGATAGPTFELFYGVDYLLPHRDAAWAVMEERIRVLAELATNCRDSCAPLYLPALTKITDALTDLADQLAEAR